MSDGIIESKLTKDPFVRRQKDAYHEAILARDKKKAAAAIGLLYQETKLALGDDYTRDLQTAGYDLPDILDHRPLPAISDLKAIYTIWDEHASLKGIGGYNEYITSQAEASAAGRLAQWTQQLRAMNE